MARASRSMEDFTRGERPSGPLQLVTDTSHDRVARRAHERYETRGREDGYDLEDWYDAERELRQEPSGSTTADAREAEEQSKPDQDV